MNTKKNKTFPLSEILQDVLLPVRKPNRFPCLLCQLWILLSPVPAMLVGAFIMYKSETPAKIWVQHVLLLAVLLPVCATIVPILSKYRPWAWRSEVVLGAGVILMLATFFGPDL